MVGRQVVVGAHLRTLAGDELAATDLTSDRDAGKTVASSGLCSVARECVARSR